MNDYSEIWLKLKQNRITQKQLAEHMHYSEQWISEVLNGKRGSEGMLMKMQKAINEIIKERKKVKTAKGSSCRTVARGNDKSRISRRK